VILALENLSVFTFLVTALWLVVLNWLVIIVLTVRGLTRQRSLPPSSSLHLTASDAPLVSILVPARNEENRVLEACIRSILAQDYGNFEVIAVNDRSTDQTGAILERLAKTDHRLRVIEGEELPAGWLGKPYAMQQAMNYARGEWILATDADMIFEPSALRTALQRTLNNNADALTLIPRFETGSFWERVMIPTWEWVFLMFAVFYRIDDPKSDRAVGIGGFFLMRRTALDRVGGYAALKDEVMEDARLAERIKRSGAGFLIEPAPALIRTRMYKTFREMWECSTKNWFSGVNFSFPFAMLCVVSMYLVAVVPPLIAVATVIGIAAGTDLSALLLPAALSWLLQMLVMATVIKRSEVSVAYALTVPLGLGLLYAMLFDSSIRITTGTGVTWKGRKIYERRGVRPPRLGTAASHISNGRN
jgi:chlorobactene glucosyltransferase